MPMYDSYFWRMSPLRRLIWLKFFAGGGSSAVLKTVTGALLHITDALAKPAKKFVATLEPIQDLHGQNAPYPAGGGKNLADYATDYIPTVGINNNITKQFRIKLKAGTYTFSCKQSVSVQTSTRNTIVVTVGSGSYQYENTGTNFNPTDLRHKLTFTVSEEVDCDFWIWCNSPTVAATYNEWQVEASASFTGYAPYSNICPITGHTGANVVGTGKNLFDASTQIHGYFAVNSLDITSNEAYRTVELYLKAGTYTLTVVWDATAQILRKYADGEIYILGVPTNSMTFTTTTDGLFAMCFRRTDSATISGTVNIQIEQGSTATSYEAYNGTTIPITFPELSKNRFNEVFRQGSSLDLGLTSRIVSANTIYVKAGETYTFSSNNYTNFYYVLNSSPNSTLPFDGNNYSYCGTSESWVQTAITFTATHDGYVSIVVRKPDSSTIIPSDVASVKMQFEQGSTATSYEPYTSTVYGCTLTHEDGEWKLRVDRADKLITQIIEGGKMAYRSGYARAYLGQQLEYPAPTGTITNFLCDTIQPKNIYSVSDNGIYIYSQQYMALSVSFDLINGYSDVGDNSNYINAINQFLSDNNIHIVYELATPIEYTLTESQALTLLKGENNIWVDDSDSLELTYYAKAESTP